MSYESTLEALKSWGCDVKGAMRRVVDDSEFYFQCIDEFIDDPNFEQLDRALAQKNLPEAFDCAHSIKGVSGNLGLTPVFDAACEVVEPLRRREEKDYTQLVNTLNAQMQKLRDIVGK